MDIKLCQVVGRMEIVYVLSIFGEWSRWHLVFEIS